MRQVRISEEDHATAEAILKPLSMGDTVLTNVQNPIGQPASQFHDKLGVIVHISDPSGTNNQYNQRYLVDTSFDPKNQKKQPARGPIKPSAATHVLCARNELTLMTTRSTTSHIASIAHVRTEAQSVVDWFQYRLDHGDILLDAWMEPSFDAAKEILRQVNLLQQMGWNTFGDAGSKQPLAKKPSLLKRLVLAIKG